MNRLTYIIEKENQTRTEQIEYTDEALQYIAQLAEGGMRDAITKLDTVLGFTQNITSEAVIKCLGLTSTQFILEILDNIIAKEPKNILGAIDTIFLEGKDLKLFIKDSIKVLIDVIKCQMGSSSENIPQSCQARVTNIIKHSTPGQLLSILDSYNSLYFKIRYEHNPKIFIESELLYLCK